MFSGKERGKMIIESIYIKNFGKLADMKINLSDGVNILRGENESGKSTLCAFIRFVFYGLSGRAEEKLKYISWGASSVSGYIIASEGGKRYRIEREAVCSWDSDGKASVRERSAVIDCDLSQAVFRGQNAGEVFFGVPAEVFESTVYIGQVGDSYVGGRTLAESAENILFSASESTNAKKAIKKLDDARVYLLYKNKRGGKIAELTSEKEELEERLEKAKAESGDIIALEGTQRELDEKIEKSKKRLALCESELDAYEKYTVRGLYLLRKEEAKKLAEMEKSVDTAQSCENHGGVRIYDEDYISSLEGLSRRLETVSARYESACRSLDDASRKIIDMSEKIEVFNRLGAGGDKRDKIVERIEKNNKKAAYTRWAAVAAAILAVIFGVCCIVGMAAGNASQTMSIILAALLGIFAVTSVVTFFSSVGAKKQLSKDCMGFGCRDYAEFGELVLAAKRDEGVLTLITEAKENAEENAKKAADELDNVHSKIVSVLTAARFETGSDYRLSLANAIKICRDEKSELEKLKIMLSGQKQKVSALEETLRSYDEDYLRDALTGVYDEQKMKSFDEKNARRSVDFLRNSIQSMTEKLSQTEKELAVLNATVKRPTEISEALISTEHELRELTEKFNAYVLAIESIEAAGGKLREGISPKLAKSASEAMSILSCGKYEALGVDPDFAITFTDGASTHTADRFSAGTSDIAYIALRLALAETLFTKAKPPLIFDESFARTDNSRLSAALRLISGGTRAGSSQCLIFTCHGREEQSMAAVGAYNLIRL